MNKKTSFLFAIALACVMAGAGCTGDLGEVASSSADNALDGGENSSTAPYGDFEENENPHPPAGESEEYQEPQDILSNNQGLESCFSPDFVSPDATEEKGADVGKRCKTTAVCRKPFLCIDEKCVAPGPWEGYCNGDDMPCPTKTMACVNFQCVNLTKRCWSNSDCSPGYECTCPKGKTCLKPTCLPYDEECLVDADCSEGQLCDFGSCIEEDQCAFSADLNREYQARSVLHLGVASESTVGKIISATQWLRDLLEGSGPFPGLSDIVSGVVSSFLQYNLKPYQVELILSLIDLPLILDTVQIQHELTLEAPCHELYRGEMTFEEIQVQYKNKSFVEKINNIRSIGAIRPAEFGATLQCRKLAIEEIEIDSLASGSVRWVTDVFVKEVTSGRHKHLEDALLGLIDCAALATYVEMALAAGAVAQPELAPIALGAKQVASIAVEPACEIALQELFSKVLTILADRPTKTGWMKLQGEAEVTPDGQLVNGHWYGRTLSDDFVGEFSAGP